MVWYVEEVYNWAPGGTARRLRRLERLRDATAREIQRELDRLAAERSSLESTPSTVMGTSQEQERE